MAARNNAKYPWAEWFGAGRFTLVPGTHFGCGTRVMRQQVWNAAERHAPGRRVSVAVRDGGVLEVTVRERSRRAARRYGGPPKNKAG